MLRYIITVMLYTVLSSTSQASVFVGGGLGVVDGLVAEAGYKMNPFLSIRGRVGYLPTVVLDPLSGSLETNGTTPFASIDNLEMNSHSFDIGAEVTPLPFLPIVRSIRFIAAIQYLNTEFDIASNVSGSMQIGNNTYTESGSLNAQIQNKQKIAPYFGIGWDIINIPFVSIRLTGAATVRSFEVSQLYATGNLANSVSESDLDAEKSDLSKEIDDNIIIPSITLTARFSMLNIPFIPIL